MTKQTKLFRVIRLFRHFSFVSYSLLIKSWGGEMRQKILILGVWNGIGTAYQSSLLPNFYQTPWFYAFCGLALALAGFAAYRLRIRHLLHRTQELEAKVAARTNEILDQRNQLAQTNALLEQAHADLLATLNQLRLGIIIVDEQRRVTYLSQTAERLLGKKREEAHGLSWEEVLGLEEKDRMRLRQISELEQSQRTKLTVHLRPEAGRSYWTEIEVRDDLRNPERKIFCLYDVSEIYDLRHLLSEKAKFHGLVGESSRMQIVYKQILDVAPVDMTVLIEGETGTGKELAARAIHFASPRRGNPFIALNCAGMTESLVASQLFGHKRGAFTGAVSDQMGVFEAAHGGTLFLDEIGDIPPSVQTSLLRVLQEREITRVGESRPRRVDARVIAATHRDLGAEVAAGRFRQDLFYRIRVARIHLPPLRDRREDIPLLVAWFLKEFPTAGEKSVQDVSQEAMQRILAYTWPGNVREMKSAIESAVLHCTGRIIQSSDLPGEITARLQPVIAIEPHTKRRERVMEVLTHTGGNRAAAAKLLGISRATLYNWLKELDIK
jgi:PAS domain S-box-containing protein